MVRAVIDPDDARTLLRRELLDPEYHDRPLIERFFDWVSRVWNELSDAAAGASPLSFGAAVVIALLLVALLAFVLPRVRRESRAGHTAYSDILGEPGLTAADLRRRAEAARREGRPGDAVADGVRAIARRMVERGILDDAPGSTAHEVSLLLAGAFPDLGERIVGATDLFDAVVYGDHAASAADADAVLALEDALQRARPRAGAASGTLLAVPR